MTGHCPKCKTRWTAYVKDVVVGDRRAKEWTCPKCGYKATQRLREHEKGSLFDAMEKFRLTYQDRPWFRYVHGCSTPISRFDFVSHLDVHGAANTECPEEFMGFSVVFTAEDVPWKQ